MAFHHISVMPEEVIDGLAIRPDGIYVDGTLGMGGHSEQIAARLTTGKLIGIDRLPTLGDALWDSSVLLDDSQGLGAFLASFAGYRAQPSGMLLLAYGLYWAFVLLRLYRPFSPKSSVSRAESCQP